MGFDTTQYCTSSVTHLIPCVLAFNQTSSFYPDVTEAHIEKVVLSLESEIIFLNIYSMFLPMPTLRVESWCLSKALTSRI